VVTSSSAPFIILSALLTGLSQHPLHLGWLSWFSIIPLIFVLNQLESLKDFIKVGYIWGVVYNLTVIFWLAMNIGTTPFIGAISMLAAVLYCSFSTLAICFIMGLIKSRYSENWIWLLPFVWTSVEYLRNMDVLTGGPWTAIANTQIDFLTLAQNAEITGIYGISFWLILLNVSIFKWIDRPYSGHAFTAINIFILPWITGLWLTPQPQSTYGSKLDVVVIQPNIHLSQKWKSGGARANIQLLLTLSESGIKEGVDLIIWPESATSSYILQENLYYLKWIQSKLDNSKLLSGIPYYAVNKEEQHFYNSVALFTADSASMPYHKMILVPMAEHIPLSDYFSSLKKLNLGQANFTHGEEYKIFNVNNTNIAAMICFESTIPSLSKEFVRRGAEVLVFVVNDGWYEYPPEPQQHAKQAVFRAIENRRPVIRCTNTGISMIIEPSGNIINSIPLNEAGVIKNQITSANGLTFYTKYGDIFAQLDTVISILFILGLFIRKK